jgi:sporulation protein YqfC
MSLNRGGCIMPRAKRGKNRFGEILEMPKEVYTNVPKLTVVGFEEMIIENYKSILEYEEFFVRINTHMGILNINGFNLNLEKMTNDDIKITGTIESIDLEKNID